jgi:hypothetical protein
MTQASQLNRDLRALDALFSDETRWTKNAFSRDGEGFVVLSTARYAACWCLHGACTRVASDALTVEGTIDQSIAKSNAVITRRTPMISALARVLNPSASPSFTISRWNDEPGRTFAHVKATIARAIEANP